MQNTSEPMQGENPSSQEQPPTPTRFFSPLRPSSQALPPAHFFSPLRPLPPPGQVPSPGPSSTARQSQKKRRPVREEPEPKKRWVWGTEDIEQLLRLRFMDECLKRRFINAKSKNDKSKAWNELALRFNDKQHLTQTVLQLQEKVDKLVAEFRKISAEEAKTGNSTIPDYPDYWEVLAECIRGRRALAGETLAESRDESGDTEEDEEFDDAEETVEEKEGKGKAAKGNQLAAALKDGMIEMAQAMKGRAHPVPAADQIQKINEGFLQIGKKLEEQNEKLNEQSEKLNKTLSQMTDVLSKLAES